VGEVNLKASEDVTGFGVWVAEVPVEEEEDLVKQSGNQECERRMRLLLMVLDEVIDPWTQWE